MIAKLLRKLSGTSAESMPERIEPRLTEREALIRRAREIQSEKQKVFDALDDATKLKLMAQVMQPTAASAKPAAAKPLAAPVGRR